MFKNAIIRYGEQPASEFLAHPHNPRKHPDKQRKLVNASLKRFGWVAPVVVNVTTGYVIDGHERVWQALSAGDDTPVPFVEVQVPTELEAELIAVFDRITYEAEYDSDNLQALLATINTDDEALAKLFAEMSEELGIVEANWDDAFAKVATEDREPFRQMTYTVHDSQFDLIERAMQKAREQGGAKSTVNENSNGNLLSFICGAYLNG